MNIVFKRNFHENKLRYQTRRIKPLTLMHSVIVGNSNNFLKWVISLSRGAVFHMHQHRLNLCDILSLNAIFSKSFGTDRTLLDRKMIA